MGIGPLNLADADLKGFEAIEPARYNGVVQEIKMDAVKNTSGSGKMPAGTPLIKIQYRLTDEGVDNRRVFQTLTIPPADYDAAKASKMKGMIARFFIELGYPEDVVISKKFNIEEALEDVVGRECVVIVGKEPKKDQNGNVVPDEFNNPVKGIKKAGSITTSGESEGGLL